MPLTIRKGVMNYKDPTTGNYVEIDALGDRLSDSIAPNYSALSFPVAEGQLCYHDDGLYKAKQAIATSESWTAAHWDSTTVEAELAGKANQSEIATVESTATASKAYSVGDTFVYNGVLYKVTSAITQGGTIVTSGTGANCAETTVEEIRSQLKTEINGKVADVKVNGTSVVTSGEANIPIATSSNPGVVKVGSVNSSGIGINDGLIGIANATSSNIKAGTNLIRPISSGLQHESVFYGLSKLAGEDLASDTVTVGTYPEKSISAIHQMLDAPVSVSGSTPSITAKSGVRYICGEVSTLTIIVPSIGIVDVTFESGSTPTVLTVTPPTGMTMRWIGDDPTNIEANKHYEINIADGCNGMVVSWT